MLIIATATEQSSPTVNGTLLQLAKEKKKSVTLTDSVSKSVLARNRFNNPADRETTTIAEAHDGMVSKNRPHSQPKRVNVPSSQYSPYKSHVRFSVAGSDGDLNSAAAAPATALPTVAVVPASGTLSSKWNSTASTNFTSLAPEVYTKTSFPIIPQTAKKKPSHRRFRGSREPCYCFSLLVLVICYSFSLAIAGDSGRLLLSKRKLNNLKRYEDVVNQKIQGRPRRRLGSCGRNGQYWKKTSWIGTGYCASCGTGRYSAVNGNDHGSGSVNIALQSK